MKTPEQLKDDLINKFVIRSEICILNDTDIHIDREKVIVDFMKDVQDEAWNEAVIACQRKALATSNISFISERMSNALNSLYKFKDASPEASKTGNK